MGHHKHWTERGSAAFSALNANKGGDSGNKNHAGYDTAIGRPQKAGNSGKAGSFEGPAKMASKTVAQLGKTSKGGKHNGLEG